MIIDGIFASQAIDSSGEILSVEGLDISDLEEGKGVLNVEHRGDESNGFSFNDIIGKVIYAKKIYSEKDCEDDRQRFYWNTIKLPMVYGKVRLYDGAGHPGAVAAAAIIRDHYEAGEPINIRYSIEGSTLEKDGQHIKRSVARRVAATIKPCNKSAISGLISDPNNPNKPLKEAELPKGDVLEELLEPTKKFEHPGFMKLGGSVEVTNSPWVRDEEMIKKAEDLAKTYSAGMAGAAPSQLTGGAALQREDDSSWVNQEKRKKFYKNQVKAAIRDWDGFGSFKDFLKHRLPQADEGYINYFGDLVDDIRVKRDAMLHKHENWMLMRNQLEDSFAELYKAAQEIKSRPKVEFSNVGEQENINSVKWRGRQLSPGEAIAHGTRAKGRFHVLHADKEHVIVLPEGVGPEFKIRDLRRWKRSQEGTHYTIRKQPAFLDDPGRVSADMHGYMGSDKAQRGLIDGALPTKESELPQHFTHGVHGSWVAPAGDGKMAVFKPGKDAPAGTNFTTAHREAAFYSLAKNFFGLGKYVPVTAAFTDPVRNQSFSAMALVPNAEHLEVRDRNTGVSVKNAAEIEKDPNMMFTTGGDNFRDFDFEPRNQEQAATLDALGDSGDLDKMAIMDVVLGNSDRHINNFLFSPNGGFHLIDHGQTFDTRPLGPPSYIGMRKAVSPWKESVSQGVIDWLLTLKPEKLGEKMQELGVPDDAIKASLLRLAKMREYARSRKKEGDPRNKWYTAYRNDLLHAPHPELNQEKQPEPMQEEDE